MRVRFVQSGGFAGLAKGLNVDTSSLDAGARDELERLVAQSGLDRSGEHLSKSGRDLRTYELTIEDERGARTVTLDEQSVPEAAKPLVGYLRQRARPQRPS